MHLEITVDDADAVEVLDGSCNLRTRMLFDIRYRKANLGVG